MSDEAIIEIIEINGIPQMRIKKYLGLHPSNTKKDHVGLIYKFVTDHVVTTSVNLVPNESGGQKLEYMPVDEVVERLCSAFEKVNDRVSGW